MFLKRLEIQGFKSFPEKIRLEFKKGITAIVGPNGSGKSNISDAIRWVLGEQSVKNLRGEKMEDVIFVGTKNRKPLGFAEVSIHIDNSDKKLDIEYSEVVITRKVYRSGESGYFINGTSCRLKDIYELFMDTGIGKEGYSIIGQGKIDAILSNKSEDRRALFEEAVGIIKFKNRKAKSEQKLDEVRKNLLRTDDIIAEIEKQLKPLFSQKEKAKEFIEISEYLKLVKVNIFKKEYSFSEKEIEEIENNIKQIIGKAYKLEDKRELLEQRKIELKTTLEEKDLEIENINNLIFENNSKLNEKENEIRLNTQNIDFIEKEIEKAKLEKQKNEENIRKKNEEIKLINVSLEAKNLEYSLKIQEAIAKNKILEQSLKSINENEQYFKNINTDIVEKLKLNTDLSNKLIAYEGLKNKLEEQKQNLLEEKAIYKSKLKEKMVRKMVVDKELLQIIENQKHLEQQNEIISNRLKKSNEKLSKLEEKILQKEKYHIEIKNKHKLLSELEKDYEGYNYSVKYLLKEKEKNKDLKGLCGAVGELIEVDKKYETAIEVALGGSIQNLITKTENDAKVCINILKQNNKGRATFLPISIIKARGFIKDKEDILKKQGVLGIASDIVRCDNLYKEIIDSILGRTIVIDNIENALSFARAYDYAYKIVTIDGNIINIGGALTGGSISKKNSLIFSRAREIKELLEEIENISLEIDKLKLDKNQKLKYNLELEKNIEKIKQDLNFVLIDKAKLETDLNQAKEYVIDLEKSVKAIYQRLEDIEKEFLDSFLDEDKLREELKQLNKEIENLREETKVFEEKINQDKIYKENMLKELNELNLQIKDLEFSIQNSKKDISRIENEIENIKSINIDIGQKAKISQQKQILATETIEEIKQTIENLNKNHISLNEKIKIVKKEKGTLSLDEQELELDIEQLRNDMTEIETEAIRIKAKKENIENKINIICENMWKDYEITYALACNEYKDIDKNIEELKKEESLLKQKISKLGNVNLSAIEEYEILEQRYKLNIKQREDIVKADEDLKYIIKTLTLEMEEQFKEQFSVINQNFGRIFSDIFGGGNAELVLSDKENILTSGIEIVASPPGKNLQSLSLLSGGERTLTAMCLLFSILIMKPSPFCILDETEAALDDANVTRYANFLKKCANDNQFILITHKTGTMEIADILYGVTMEEQGVSKVISVELKDAKEYNKI